LASVRSVSMRGFVRPCSPGRKRDRIAFQSASVSLHRVMAEQVARSSGTVPFVQAYMSSWV
jgi:hypothetical protein